MITPDGHLVASPRKIYYNPKLDPLLLDHKMTHAMAEAVVEGTYDDGSVERSGPLHEGLDPDLYRPNLISSLCEDGLHRPAIDFDHYGIAELDVRECFGGYFDVPLHEVIAVRSTTHWHVYLPCVALDEDRYFEALDGMESMGLIETGYLYASKNRGQTLLRPPELTKQGWRT